MDLRRYLFEKRLTQIEFAKQIEYNVQYLRAVLAKRLKAGTRMKKTIERVTNGEVKQEEV